jgi:kynurenine formamidase
MSNLLDLSHVIEPDMPRFASIDPPQVRPVWTHSEAAARGYQGTTCEVTEVRLVTSIGTYLDAPFHFDPDGADISQLPLSQLVLPGVVLDLRDVSAPDEPLPAGALDSLDAAGKAVLLYTGWSAHWGTDRYYHHPYVSRTMAEQLRACQPALIGIDTLVVDSHRDPTRPCHTMLLRAGILIVENLTGLGELVGQTFTFVAAPVKVAGAAAFPVRAFAMRASPQTGGPSP